MWRDFVAQIYREVEICIYNTILCKNVYML